MTGWERRPERVRMPHVEQLAERLSPRDWVILETLDRVRIANGIQLERLHFSSLSSARSRAVVRWAVLKRLVRDRALTTLDRRIGSSLHGSAKLRYVLDSAGQRLIRLRASHENPGAAVRRPRSLGERFVAHTLAVTELYVELVERSRQGGFTVGAFLVEGDAYWPNGPGGWLRMDAFIRLDLTSTDADYWWYEGELAIKSEPAVRRKLQAYLNFWRSGQTGPDGTMPRVFIGVENGAQLHHIQSVVEGFSEVDRQLFRVSALPQVAEGMVEELYKPTGGKS